MNYEHHKKVQREAREAKVAAKAERERLLKVAAEEKRRAFYQTSCMISKQQLLELLVENGFLESDTESLLALEPKEDSWKVVAMRFFSEEK